MAKLLGSLRTYTKVALLGAIASCLMLTMFTGVVLDVVLVGMAIALGFLFVKL